MGLNDSFLRGISLYLGGELCGECPGYFQGEISEEEHAEGECPGAIVHTKRLLGVLLMLRC